MNLGDRMKAYENTFRSTLPIRMPVIIRVDGKAFHSVTQKCERPFDNNFQSAISYAALDAMSRPAEKALGHLGLIPARMAYQQSDEVSFLLIDYNKFDTEQWFKGNIQKMASVAAALMSVHFSERWGSRAVFDGRVFAVPERDIENYFIWRQRDCMRNAISAAAQAQFSHKQLHGKNSDEMKRMLAEKGIAFDDYRTCFRHGSIIHTKPWPEDAQVFSENREFLKRFLTIEEE